MLEIKNKELYGSKRECIVNTDGDILSIGDTKKQIDEGIISLLDGVYAYNEGKIFNLSKIYGNERFSLDELIKIKKELNLNDGYIYVLDAYETYNTYILYTNEELKEIRKGNWSLEKLMMEHERQIGMLDKNYEESKLPKRPNMDKVEKIVVEIIEKRLRSVNQ